MSTREAQLDATASPPLPPGTATDSAFDAAVARLLGRTDFNVNGAVDPRQRALRHRRVTELLHQLDSPHIACPTVHVAGTNGKGSVAAMVTSVLAAAGLRVGLFTSPHLHSIVERIRVGLTPVSRSQFVALLDTVWPVAERISASGELGLVTTLEVLMAMGFVHFRAQRLDYQVIEVFVGGREDATNIVQPCLSVITNVSRDHVPALGNTLTDIARAKAGIIKRGVTVVTAPQLRSVAAVIAEQAAALQAPLCVAAAAGSDKSATPMVAHQPLVIRGRHGTYRVQLPLLGRWQRENARVAVAAVEALIDDGAAVTGADIVAGLHGVHWPARFEVLRRTPHLVVADGAHCPRSMACMAAELARWQEQDGEVWALIGSQHGHQATDTVAQLRPLRPHIVTTRSQHPRAVPAAALATALRAAGLAVSASSASVADGLGQVLGRARHGALVVATGSLAVAAEARTALSRVGADGTPINY